MIQDLIAAGFDTLLARNAPGGGFINRNQGSYRPDVTAWAILALAAGGCRDSRVQTARDRLAADQQPDGRLALASHEEVFWPTALAVMAWQASPKHQDAQTRAVHYLLITSGLHWAKVPESPVAHDPNLKGWPWTADTHSWTDPTALAVIALKVAGFADHERVKEGENLLMNRQLPKGGWNYGNTLVFGQELRPLPESTGLALNALSGSVSRERVERSLAYLQARSETVRTPRSLAWSLMGLGAWGERPPKASDSIVACLAKQGRYGGYDTVSLALLLLSFQARQGLAGIFQNSAGGGRVLSGEVT